MRFAMAALGKELKAKIEELTNILTVEPQSSIDKIEVSKKMRAFSILEREIYGKTSSRIQQTEFGNYIRNKDASLKQPIIDLITSLKSLAKSKSQKELEPHVQTTLRLRIEAIIKIKAFTDIFGDSFEAPSPIEEKEEEEKEATQEEEISSDSDVQKSPEKLSPDSERERSDEEDKLEAVESKDTDIEKSAEAPTKFAEDIKSIRAGTLSDALTTYAKILRNLKSDKEAHKDALILIAIKLAKAHNQFAEKDPKKRNDVDWKWIREDVQKLTHSEIFQFFGDLSEQISSLNQEELSSLCEDLSDSYIVDERVREGVEKQFIKLNASAIAQFEKERLEKSQATFGGGVRRYNPSLAKASANEFCQIARISDYLYNQRSDSKEAKENIFKVATLVLDKVINTPGAIDQLNEIISKDKKNKENTYYDRFFLSLACHCHLMDEKTKNENLELFIYYTFKSLQDILEKDSKDSLKSFIGVMKQFYDLSGAKAFCNGDKLIQTYFSSIMKRLNTYYEVQNPIEFYSFEGSVAQGLKTALNLNTTFTQVKRTDKQGKLKTYLEYTIDPPIAPKMKQDHYIRPQTLVGVFMYDALIEKGTNPNVAFAIEANGVAYHYQIFIQKNGHHIDNYLDGKSVFKQLILRNLQDKPECLSRNKHIVLVNVDQRDYYYYKDLGRDRNFLKKLIDDAERTAPKAALIKKVVPVQAGHGKIQLQSEAHFPKLGAGTKKIVAEPMETKEKLGDKTKVPKVYVAPPIVAPTVSERHIDTVSVTLAPGKTAAPPKPVTYAAPDHAVLSPLHKKSRHKGRAPKKGPPPLKTS